MKLPPEQIIRRNVSSLSHRRATNNIRIRALSYVILIFAVLAPLPIQKNLDIQFNMNYTSLLPNMSRKLGLGRFSRVPALIRGIHVAIVGSGPSGFYTAKYLLERGNDINIDMYERLPTPYGLVRYGVAPDHQEVKAVMSTFTEVANNPRFRYFGNVQIGNNPNSTTSVCVSMGELRMAYQGVVLAYGASTDSPLNIPGENLNGVMSARCFVNWYNGHPEYTHYTDIINLKAVKHVVIIGNGNVAIDCARILAKDPLSELRTTDITDYAITALQSSSVETITIIGRRGHAQASFTIKEFRELTKLSTCTLSVDPQELEAGMTESTNQELQSNRPKKRICDLIASMAKLPDQNQTKKHISMRFLLTPLSYTGSSSRVNGLVVRRNVLEGPPGEQKAVMAKDSDHDFILPCDLALESVGFRSLPIDNDIPFNNRSHTIPNINGRVVSHDDQVVPGLYVAGWLKRGPSGIIGTNIPDAKETASAVLEDVSSNIIGPGTADPVSALPQLQSKHVVSWNQYMSLENHETKLGASRSPPQVRSKVTSIDNMLGICTGSGV